MTDQLTEARRCAQAVHLACEAPVAADIARVINGLVSEIERLTVERDDWVIKWGRLSEESTAENTRLTVELDAARSIINSLASRTGQSEEPDEKINVFFQGGPWQGQSFAVDRVVGPVFAVGHPVGGAYWLDAKSDPPTYHWEAEP